MYRCGSRIAWDKTHRPADLAMKVARNHKITNARSWADLITATRASKLSTHTAYDTRC
jgi:hypothetical protein